MTDLKPRILRKFVLVNSQGAGSLSLAAPGSGATITIWDSGDNLSGNAARHPTWTRWERFPISLITSHAGTILVEATADDGTNWDSLYSIAVPGSTTVTFQRDIYPGAYYPRGRIRYTNSASVLTAWRGTLAGIINRALAA
jgi:hypothetical protein